MQFSHESTFARGYPGASWSLPYPLLGAALGAAEAATIVAAGLMGTTLYRVVSGIDDAGHGITVKLSVVSCAIFLLLARSQGLYALANIVNQTKNLGVVVRVLGTTLLITVGLQFLLKTSSDFSRGSMVMFALTSIVALPLVRFIFGDVARAMLTRGWVRGPSAVVIGDPDELGRVEPREWSRFGVEEVARFSIRQERDTEGPSEHDYRQVANAVATARRLRASEFAVALKWGDPRLTELLARLRQSPLPVRLYPDARVREVLFSQPGSCDPSWYAVSVQREPLTFWERATKRTFDIAFSGLALLALSPLLLAVAVAIKLESSGPVIFRQRRRGFDGRPFVIFKFRSMKVMEDSGEIKQATRGDSRVTRVGRFLRMSSIDELPQLFNVLRGDMSVVGPRPHALAHDEEYERLINDYACRQHVKPGLTGAAQVSGLRGETTRLEDMEKRVQRDLWYVSNWSLALDVKLITQTVWTLVRHAGY